VQTEGTLLTSGGSHKGVFHVTGETYCWSRIATESTQKHFQLIPAAKKVSRLENQFDITHSMKQIFYEFKIW
jgi:CO dehydrogenase/acetyl-CoA synthase beta subunit